MTSIDEDVEEMWTFYSLIGDEKFTLPIKVAKLSGVFKSMIENSENEHAVSLQVVNQVVNGTNEVYQINTDKFLKYVYEYFKLWETCPEKANYVDVAPVQTSEIEHILQEKDIVFIKNYLAKEIPDFKGSESEIRRKHIETLGKLLSQVDEFLDIQSLSNKIYAYIAVLVWNTSIVDFAEALNDPGFKAAQDDAIAQWEKDNPNKFASYVRNHTTGSTFLAPSPKKEISNADLHKLIELSNDQDSDQSLDFDLSDSEHSDESDD